MKKFTYLISLLLLVLIPFKVAAIQDINSYTTRNLEETLEADDIDITFKNYSESQNQVTIYLFWRYGCPYCGEFLTYLDSIADEYGKYFKLVSFEVSQDSANSDLLDEVGEFVDYDVQGVPFITIGEKIFPGYDSSWNEDILNTIIDEYDKDEKYDVLSEMKKAQDEELRKNKISNLKQVIYNLIIIIGAVIILCFFIKKQNNKIHDRLDVIYEKLNIALEDEEQDDNTSIVTDDENNEIATNKKNKTNKQVKKSNNNKKINK